MNENLAWRQVQIERLALYNLPDRIHEAVSEFNPQQRFRLAPLVHGLSLNAEKTSHTLRPDPGALGFGQFFLRSGPNNLALPSGFSEPRWRVCCAPLQDRLSCVRGFEDCNSLAHIGLPLPICSMHKR
jgi:hypothetical protein